MKSNQGVVPVMAAELGGDICWKDRHEKKVPNLSLYAVLRQSLSSSCYFIRVSFPLSMSFLKTRMKN